MDDITKKILEELVINFISEMNEWEKYYNEFDEDQLELDETEHKIKQMVASIISKYCTDKERKMSRPNALSWGLEGSYDYDPNKEKIIDEEYIELYNFIRILSNKYRKFIKKK